MPWVYVPTWCMACGAIKDLKVFVSGRAPPPNLTTRRALPHCPTCLPQFSLDLDLNLRDSSPDKDPFP